MEKTKIFLIKQESFNSYFEIIFRDDKLDYIENKGNDDIGENIHNADYVIIFDPIKIKDMWLSVYKIWNKYLRLKFTSKKLLIAGFENIEHTNYIDLLKPPENITLKLKEAETVQKTKNLELYTTDIFEELRQYISSHGKESFLSRYTQFSQMTELLKYLLLTGKYEQKNYFDKNYVHTLITSIKNDLKNLSEFFLYLPFNRIPDTILGDIFRIKEETDSHQISISTINISLQNYSYFLEIIKSFIHGN